MIWSQINYKSKFLEKYEHLKRCSVELKFSLEGLFELHIARRQENISFKGA
jgi:hypothetical protein